MTFFRSKCRECGTKNAVHVHEWESCIECQIDQINWELSHHSARIWRDNYEEEHPEIRAYITRRRAALRKVRLEARR